MSGSMEVARVLSPEVQIIQPTVSTAVVQIGEKEFTREQVQLLKDTICKGSTDDEFRFFLEVCRSKKLDPFAKQIHPVKRWDATLGREVMSFQTGIDGFRLIAQRTGEYAGQDEPMWCGEDGKWTNVWLLKQPPQAARATVYRKGFTKPMTRIALYREYVQTKKDGTPNSMWNKMPANQLHKCAEALSLRAAFPEELSGIYTNEEMGQADNSPPEVSRIDTGGHPVGTKAAADHVAARKIEELRNHKSGSGYQATDDDIPSNMGGAWEDPQTHGSAEKKVEAARQNIERANVPPHVQAVWARMRDFKATLEVFAELKRDLSEVLGKDSGERLYYGALGRQGVEHANQFKTTRPARLAAQEMVEAIAAAQIAPEAEWTAEPAQ